jgi:hypothetical protein
MPVELPSFNPSHMYLVAEPRVTISNAYRDIRVIWPVDGNYKLHQLLVMLEAFKEFEAATQSDGGVVAVDISGDSK